MLFSGPLPVPPSSSSQPQDIHLRLQQRFNAEIVEVSGTQVVLSVNGTPVVARLEAAEQGAQLAGRRTAQFIVTALTEGEIEIKLAGQTQAVAGTGAAAVGDIVASNLLVQLGIEVSEENILLTQALISQHLPVTPELLVELGSFLDQIGAWSETGAAQAAAIKAAGLPLTVGVYQLASAQHLPIAEAAVDLMAQLRAALQRPNLAAHVADAARSCLAVLENAMLQWTGSQMTDMDSFRLAAQLFGRSLENFLATGLNQSTESGGESSLGTFLRLNQACQSAKEGNLGSKVSSFLMNLDQTHLANVRLDPVPGKGEWIALPLLIKNEAGREPAFLPARVRIARKDGKDGAGVDPASTRLQIRVDFDAQQSIEVDLTLVKNQTRIKVTAPTADLQQRSQEELPGLAEGLQRLGLRLTGANFVVDQPVECGLIAVLPMSEMVKKQVNIKV